MDRTRKLTKVKRRHESALVTRVAEEGEEWWRVLVAADEGWVIMVVRQGSSSLCDVKTQGV